jgi:hypothetical protein
MIGCLVRCIRGVTAGMRQSHENHKFFDTLGRLGFHLEDKASFIQTKPGADDAVQDGSNDM